MINFIGLGAQKSGTSWAYACLYEHPEVCAPVKEIHFFSRPRFEKGKNWYESHFVRCDTSKLKGEFSTSYLYSKEAPERIHSLYPNTKLIVILRNPVTRAVSQYFNAIKSGEIDSSVTFDIFTQQEQSVLGQGLYATQLKHYLSLFKREQILILIYEDIKKNPRTFMQLIYRFLAIEDTFEASMLETQVNIARTPKMMALERIMHHVSEFLRKIGLDKMVHTVRKSGLPDFVRKYNTQKKEEVIIDTKTLAAYFKADVEELSLLLGRDLRTEWNI
jgi:hypothetical protein